jgi:preprotein translocase subunit SecA
MDGMLQRLGLEQGEAIIHPWINKAIEKAQQKVEARNFDIRKNLLQFDDVMNDQRRVIFDQRKEMMQTEDLSELVTEMRHEVIEDFVAKFIPEKAMHEEWDLVGLHEECLRVLSLDLPLKDWAQEEGIADEEIRERIVAAADKKFGDKVAVVGPEIMRRVEKSLILQMIDQGWRDHLLQLDMLRHGVNLRAYGQKQPLLEYQREAFNMFNDMLSGLRERVTSILSRVEFKAEPAPEDLQPRMPTRTREVHETINSGIGDAGRPQEPGLARALPRVAPESRNPNDPSTWGKVARNESCPCGSGKKYKHCHGAVEDAA